MVKKFVDHRKRAALQWLRDPSKINADYVNCVRRKSFTQFEKRARRNLGSKLMRLQQTARTVRLQTCVGRVGPCP